MFYDGSTFMVGMHWFWWIFWVVLIGVVMFYGWGRPSEQRRRPRETTHEVLQRRLASDRARGVREAQGAARSRRRRKHMSSEPITP